jgi:hypothetical protein
MPLWLQVWGFAGEVAFKVATFVLWLDYVKRRWP